MIAVGKLAVNVTLVMLWMTAGEERTTRTMDQQPTIVTLASYRCCCGKHVRTLLRFEELIV